MAGILNNKSRILDVILTDIGRDQMNRGEFEVSFATFSDNGTQYVEDDDNPGVMASIGDNLYFETFSCPYDEIVPEIDNVGDFILTRQVSPTLTVKDGVLYEKSGSFGEFTPVDGFDNISKFTDLTTKRWSGLQLLKTESSLPKLELSRYSAEIDIKEDVNPADVGGLPPILVDPRFSGNINTMYLPPRVTVAGQETVMRAYNQYSKPYSRVNVVSEIQNKSKGSASFVIGKDDAFQYYNFIAQGFVGINQSVKKFLVVDAGEFVNDDNVPVMQIYHLGFIFKDGAGISKFSRGFSIVFHNEGVEL